MTAFNVAIILAFIAAASAIVALGFSVASIAGIRHSQRRAKAIYEASKPL